MENEVNVFAPVASGEAPLDSWARQIKQYHEEAGVSLGNAFHNAIQAGRVLQEAKDEIAHGNFGKWVDENLNFNLRTAQRYMNMFAHAAELEEVKPETLSEAYKLLETPRPAPEVSDEEFSGEFGEDDEPETLTTGVEGYEVEEYTRHPYWPALKQLVDKMDKTYLKLAALRDHTTPKALGYMIGNIKEMSTRLDQWDPEKLFSCAKCGGTMQISDPETGQPTDCPICVQGKVGPYKETDL